MQMTAGNGPSAFLGRARFNCKCWLSGLLYSIPVSNCTPSGTAGCFWAVAAELQTRERIKVNADAAAVNNRDEKRSMMNDSKLRPSSHTPMLSRPPRPACLARQITGDSRHNRLLPVALKKGLENAACFGATAGRKTKILEQLLHEYFRSLSGIYTKGE